MANRHQRRKAATVRLLSLVEAQRSVNNAKIVQANLSSPHRPERSPHGLGNRSIYTGTTGCRASGGHQRLKVIVKR